jgi:hypothetical protein
MCSAPGRRGVTRLNERSPPLTGVAGSKAAIVDSGSISIVQSDIPAATRDFVAKHIVSLEQLEVLLILHDGTERDWSAAEINERLRSQENSIQKWLDTLVAIGLAAGSQGRYKFAPASQTMGDQTAALAEAYRERRIKVIELIFSKPNEPLLNFVRAFELKKR